MGQKVYGPADTPRAVRLEVGNPPLTGPPDPRRSVMPPPPRPDMTNRVPPPPQPPRGNLPDSEYLNDIANVQRLVTRELEQWIHDLQPFYDKVDASWARWHLQVPGGTNPPVESTLFRSQVQSAYLLYAVEQVLPRVLGTTPKMDYKPLDTDEDSLIACLLGKVVSSQMQRMGFEYEARDFIRQGLVSGYSVGKLYWVRQTAYQDVTNIEQHELLDEEPGFWQYQVEVPGKEPVVIVNEPRFESVNVKDFAWPLYAKNLNDAKAVWQRRWLTMAELEEKAAAGVYQNVDMITPSDANRWTQAYDPQFSAQGLHVTPPMTQTNDLSDADALIEVWERWTNDRLLVIASRRYCIRDEPNPFWHKRKPFVDFTPTPRPFQLQGQSIDDAIRDSNDSLTTLMRQVSDAITYLINPAFKSTGGVDWGNFIMQPGAHLDLDDTEDVQPLATPNVDLAAALSWRQAHLEDMQKYSGVFDIMGGGISGFHTATGVSTVIQQATMRLQEMANVFAYRTMRPFGWMMERLNAQYLDESMLVDFSNDPRAQQAWEEYVRGEQPQGVLQWIRDRTGTGQTLGIPPSGLVQIKPEMVRAQGRLEPTPMVGQDEQLDETQKRSDATQFLQAVAPMIASPNNPLNMPALVDWMAQQFGISPQVRKAIVATPPAQQMQALQEAMPQGATPSGPSGPSGDNPPSGGVVGAPGAAGGSGPPGLGPGR